jgi:hypothetical protein
MGRLTRAAASGAGAGAAAAPAGIDWERNETGREETRRGEARRGVGGSRRLAWWPQARRFAGSGCGRGVQHCSWGERDSVVWEGLDEASRRQLQRSHSRLKGGCDLLLKNVVQHCSRSTEK